MSILIDGGGGETNAAFSSRRELCSNGSAGGGVDGTQISDEGEGWACTACSRQSIVAKGCKQSMVNFVPQFEAGRWNRLSVACWKLVCSHRSESHKRGLEPNADLRKMLGPRGVGGKETNSIELRTLTERKIIDKVGGGIFKITVPARTLSFPNRRMSMARWVRGTKRPEAHTWG